MKGCAWTQCKSCVLSASSESSSPPHVIQISSIFYEVLALEGTVEARRLRGKPPVVDEYFSEIRRDLDDRPSLLVIVLLHIINCQSIIINPHITLQFFVILLPPSPPLHRYHPTVQTVAALHNLVQD